MRDGSVIGVLDDWDGNFYSPGPGVTTVSIAAIFPGRRGGPTMAAIDDDDRPKKKIAHEIGQNLTLLSVGELNERIVLLEEEIARLEADIHTKQASKSAADLFFKK
jgi:uncharacterized small protein (DUF1192 family)